MSPNLSAPVISDDAVVDVQQPKADGDARPSHTSSSSPPLWKPPTPRGEDPEHPTNIRLLIIAFISFLTFALIQLVFALAAGSKAMLGDSSAMIVDAFTYLFNFYALRRKSRLDVALSVDITDADPAHAAYIRERTKRKITKQLEIIPPLISVTTLIIVTIWIIDGSVHVLLHGVDPNAHEPNIKIIMGFSCFNLLLDFFNVFCFARARHMLGYDIIDEERTVDEAFEPTASVKQDKPGEGDFAVDTIYGSSSVLDNDSLDVELAAPSTNVIVTGYLRTPKPRPNLNMCSAYTHVMADTLRSIAVVLAAGFALIFPDQISPANADSVAALVVSALILLSLLPLLQGLVRNSRILREILAEERSERV